MIGLSITAIGGRRFEESLEIYTALGEALDCTYLELAIGCPPSQYLGVQSAVLHDCCLFDVNGKRQPFSLLESNTWLPYKQFCTARHVRAFGFHAPLRTKASLKELHQAVIKLEKYLHIPVMIESMPTPDRWCSDRESCQGLPLLLDVSHVLIWHRGNHPYTAETCFELLPSAVGVHLSHNQGWSDDHDLIPEDIWFQEYIPEWSRSLFVTYESLPARFARYERLDKLRLRRLQEHARLASY